MQDSIQHAPRCRSVPAVVLLSTLTVVWFCTLACAALWVAVAAYRAAAISH